MGFFGLFRSKEEKLTEAIAALYVDIGLATFKTEGGVAAILKEKLETALEPSASYDLRCEIFCFYVYVMGYLLLGTLGERRALSVRAQLIPLGLEPFVQSSLSKRDAGVWEPRLTDSPTQVARVLDLYSKVMDMIEHNLVREIDYFRTQDMFANDVAQAYQRGDVPGLTDALSEEPDSAVSLLVQNVYKTLQAYTPELGPDLDILRERSDTLGSDTEAIGFVELCRTIHTSVWVGIFNEINLPEKLQKMGRPIQ